MTNEMPLTNDIDEMEWFEETFPERRTFEQLEKQVIVLASAEVLPANLELGYAEGIMFEIYYQSAPEKTYQVMTGAMHPKKVGRKMIETGQQHLRVKVMRKGRSWILAAPDSEAF